VGIYLAGAAALSDLRSWPSFLRRSPEGVTIDLRVQPRARRIALEISAGTLKVAVTAPPEDGKANDAVIALLARTWRLPKSTFAVIKGMTARDKVVSVRGDPARLVPQIEQWAKENG
jgi:uncharacterized protein (TIGR00251 family)